MSHSSTSNNFFLQIAIIEFVIFGILHTTYICFKKHIHRPIKFGHEVVKQGVAKYLQIMSSLAKIFVISLYFVSPGYRIYKKMACIIV